MEWFHRKQRVRESRILSNRRYPGNRSTTPYFLNDDHSNAHSFYFQFTVASGTVVEAAPSPVPWAVGTVAVAAPVVGTAVAAGPGTAAAVPGIAAVPASVVGNRPWQLHPSEPHPYLH